MGGYEVAQVKVWLKLKARKKARKSINTKGKEKRKEEGKEEKRLVHFKKKILIKNSN